MVRGVTRLLTFVELERSESLLGRRLSHPEGASCLVAWAHVNVAPLIAANKLLLRLVTALVFIHQSETTRGVIPTMPNGDVLDYAKTLGWKGTPE